MPKCDKECEVYSRITGYHRPLKNWNAGKQNEFKNRKPYVIKTVVIKKEIDNGK
jgi:ribonucleoside-triphosphate reductase